MRTSPTCVASCAPCWPRGSTSTNDDPPPALCRARRVHRHVSLRARQRRQARRRASGAACADVVGRTPQTYEIVIQLLGTEFLRFTLDEETMLAASLDGVGDSLPMRNL